MQEQDIPTPAVIVDLAQASRNTRRLVQYLRGHGMKLRPHTKTHKSARLGALQIEWGAEGLAVAKLGEAEVMARVTDDVLVGYPALDPARTAAAAELARQVKLRVAVDSRYAADALAGAARQAGSTIGILVDLDVGLHRTGVQGADESRLRPDLLPLRFLPTGRHRRPDRGHGREQRSARKGRHRQRDQGFEQ
jgi:D-serine deaminase-like pyridoxal phosphate-dependent protein